MRETKFTTVLDNRIPDVVVPVQKKIYDLAELFTLMKNRKRVTLTNITEQQATGFINGINYDGSHGYWNIKVDGHLLCVRAE